MKENTMNANYDPNKPRNRQNNTRFCAYCKRSGHPIAFFEREKHDEQKRQPPCCRDKITDTYQRSPSNE